MTAGEIARAFRDAEIRWLLLKGPSIASRLYADGDSRFYVDVDALVPPPDHARAQRVLAELGFVERAYLPRQRVEHAGVWERARQKVDLHRRFPHIPAGPDAIWHVFSRKTETVKIADENVEIPGLGATALIVALHALHHGTSVDKPMTDLARAIDRFPYRVWREAVEIAEELGAARNLSAALSLGPSTEVLRNSLGLPEPSRWEVYLRSGDRARLAAAFALLEDTRGFKGKATTLWRELVPEPDVRAGEIRRHYGGSSAARIHGRRVVRIVSGIPQAFLARRLERRDARELRRRHG